MLSDCHRTHTTCQVEILRDLSFVNTPPACRLRNFHPFGLTDSFRGVVNSCREVCMLDLPQAATSATCQRQGDGAGHTEQDGSQVCWHSHLSNAGARLCGRLDSAECLNCQPLRAIWGTDWPDPAKSARQAEPRLPRKVSRRRDVASQGKETNDGHIAADFVGAGRKGVP